MASLQCVEFPGFRGDLATLAGMDRFVLLRTDTTEVAVWSRCIVERNVVRDVGHH